MTGPRESVIRDPQDYRVEAPHFVAMFITRPCGHDSTDNVVYAAPILWKHVYGLELDEAMAYCHGRGWKVERL